MYRNLNRQVITFRGPGRVVGIEDSGRFYVALESGEVDYFYPNAVEFADSDTAGKSAQALAEAHWEYVNALLDLHCPDDDMELIKFHYISAFVHGYKHAKEEQC